jgi:predicted Zn-dependent protease
VETFFSNHPSPQDRVDELVRIVPSRRAGRRDSAEFRSIRARILARSKGVLTR